MLPSTRAPTAIALPVGAGIGVLPFSVAVKP